MSAAATIHPIKHATVALEQALQEQARIAGERSPAWWPAKYIPASWLLGVPAPMLARLESTLPRGPEWRYEPNLDGFRGLLWRSNTGATRVLSRNLKDLSISFPELVRAAAALPLDTAIDGEIVSPMPTAIPTSARCSNGLARAAATLADPRSRCPRCCSPLTWCAVREPI